MASPFAEKRLQFNLIQSEWNWRWKSKEQEVFWSNICKISFPFNPFKSSLQILNAPFNVTFFQWFAKQFSITRMHSSRMRTARTLTVSPSMLQGGWSAAGGGLLLGGCLLLGGVCSQGVSAAGRVSAPGGLVSQHAVRQTPPLWTEWKTGAKYILAPNFVCGR